MRQRILPKIVRGEIKAAPASLIEEKRVLDLLDRIVCSLASERALRQDLMQEGLVHLWRIERERPGQTTSWYLQSCRFCLQHYLASGRSVDSIKRRSAQVPLFEDDSESTGLFEQFTEECPELNHASARDIISSISRRLKPKECAVLDCLADGLSTRDIAKRLNLSSPTVTKYRRNIAGFAFKLGIAEGRHRVQPLLHNCCRAAAA